jgi:ubiquinone/menaquinone biosynthesis C-methylase UbiE
MAGMHDEDRAVAAKFDQLARDGFMAEFQEEEQRKLATHLARWVLTPGLRVLEPGCGTGRLTELLAGRVGLEGEVLAFDVSPEMVALARRRRHAVRVSCEVGDGRAVDRSDAYFDRIICFQVFPHFVHRDKVLHEFRRLLRSDGTLWISHLIGREQVNEIHRGAGPPLDTHILPDDTALRAVLATAGFKLVKVEEDANGFSASAVPVACT